MDALPANVRKGIRGGIVIGATWAVGGLIQALVRGPTFVHQQYNMSLFGLIAYNLLGGAGTGAIVGVLLPVASRSAVGAAMVGFVAMLPVSFITIAILAPVGQLHRYLPAVPLVMAAVLGGLGGPAIRSQSLGETEPSWRFIGFVVGVGTLIAVALYLAGWWW